VIDYNGYDRVNILFEKQ